MVTRSTDPVAAAESRARMLNLTTTLAKVQVLGTHVDGATQVFAECPERLTPELVLQDIEN